MLRLVPKEQFDLPPVFHTLNYLNNHSLYNCPHVFIYKHSVFQSEAQICLSFSQIQPRSMLKICLSKNIEKSKIHDLTHGGVS